jgi:predicted HAD superfamily Cof-like phosphohydrolase
MIKEQQDVTDFMVGVGQSAPDKPTELDEATAKLRIGLIMEELSELTVAMGFSALMGQRPVNFNGDWNMVEVADAIADILYVTYGTAAACGIDMEPIWNEVQRSNMTKLVDGHRREDGKWMKGPSYSPAELAPLVKAQME